MSKVRIISLLIAIMCGVSIYLLGYEKLETENATLKYQVYLDGEKLGLISSTDDLYSLINNEQSVLKNEYNVEQVYPPKGFEVEKYVSYNDDLTTVENVYNKIKDKKSFTIKGYVVSIVSPETEDSEAKVLYKINVLSRDIIDEAIQNIVNSFVSAEKYKIYMEDEQAEIKDVGSLIENMYFKESIVIRESYLSTEEKIYTNADDLTRYLMFGDSSKEKYYTVKQGDTIEKVAEANKINTTEFLIANPDFTSEFNMLAIGEKVNVSLVSPLVSLVYDMYVVEDNEVPYNSETKYDDSKSTGYRVVTVKGQNGIQRVSKHIQVTNGIENQGAVIDGYVTIKEPVTEVVTRGRKVSYYSTGTYYDDGQNWAWPTNYPYVITSPFGWRGGEYHTGVDISGTGFGSPIYAIGSGTVISAGWGGMVGKDAGMNVVIEHPNGYYSIYAHLSGIKVNVGDRVSRKQLIGTMGKTGRASGTHLHLGITVGGPPYNGGQFLSPLSLWK